MAQRLTQRSGSFHILPRDTPGDGDFLTNIAPLLTSDKSVVGDVHYRRRRRKGRKSIYLRPTLSLLNSEPSNEISDSKSLSISSPLSDPNSDHNALSRCPSFSDRFSADAWSANGPLLNGSLLSSSKAGEANYIESSQLGAANGESKAMLSEGCEKSCISCTSDFTAGMNLTCTPVNNRECDQLTDSQHYQNGVLGSFGVHSAALVHNQAKDSELLPSLRVYSNGECVAIDGGVYHGNGLPGKDSLSPGARPDESQHVVNGSIPSSVQLSISELRQRIAHALENDTCTSQGNHSFECSPSQTEVESTANDQGDKQGAELYDRTPEGLNSTPVVHTGTPQLLDWERLMAANSSCSQPANVSPMQYFFGEVLCTGTLQNTESAENDKKRQHVYNTMFHVPWRCELLIVVGFFVCLDSFLTLLTVMPLRIIIFLWRCFRNRRQLRRPQADELSDLVCLLVLVSGVTLLQQADISYIYHMIRSQATIKLYVVYNVLEIFDKLCQSFGSDVLQVVLNSAESVAQCSHDRLLFESLQFAMDQCIAVFSFMIHSLIILALSITVSAAIRSHNNALLTLLISNNFAEIKSNVFKRLAKDNLHKLAYLDTVERFHIVAHLFFVWAQNLLAANEPWLLSFISNAGMVLLCEILVDAIKHAFLAKFNEIKPAAYSGFLEALCKQTLKSQSHDVHKTLAFVPLAPACVVIRVLIPLYAAYLPQAHLWRFVGGVLCGSVTYIILVMLKILVGLGLLKHANWYVNRCMKKQKHFHSD